MSLYTTRRTPVPRDEPPHMVALPRPRTRSTGPVGTTPAPPRSQSRREGRSPTLTSVSSVTPSHHTHDLPFGGGPLTGTPPFNVPRHVLPRSPLGPITEHSMATGFAPVSASTPYGVLEEAAPPSYPVASPTREAPSAFMQLLDRLMNTRSVAPRTGSRDGPPSFRAPYPMTSPLMAPTGVTHSPNPRPIVRDDQMASVTRTLNPVEEEYLPTFHLTPQGTRTPPQPSVPIAPQQRPTYVPPWPPAQSGPFPPMPPAQPAPMAPVPVPLAPPGAPPQAAYPPGWGAPMPPYGYAPTQPYPNAYPPVYWPPYLPHFVAPQGSLDEDSETAKPDKFTGRDPSKLRPFIVSCVMAFDSRPRKFTTDRQRVSFAASYLSDIAMLWWQPTLVAFPEPSIRGDWGEFVDQLNVYFGQPDLAQASERALRALKMYDHQHVNKYMIEFSEHVTHMGWNDAALYGEFYRGLAERIKDQLLSLDRPQTFQQLKVDALRCDTRYWERQGEKTAPSSRNRQSASSFAPAKQGNNPTTSSNAPIVNRTNPGIGADGKLTQEERERHRLQGLCYYCGLTIDLPAPDCRNSRHPKPPVAGRATFTITGEPGATIEEEVEDLPTESEN